MSQPQPGNTTINININHLNDVHNYIHNDTNLINEFNNIYNNDNAINPINPINPINEIYADSAADNSNKPKRKVSKRVCKKSASVGMMPAFSEYDAFMKSEHKVSELKNMCKHYGIKCSGTKQELKLRVHTHLIQSHHIKRIQHMIRRNFIKMHARMSGPAYNDRTI